ncbi:MAG: hypothetical protein HY081_05820 [Gammaproteobacteria bacterium]|nr:hypothetical protein [Gammaproteobacteria bacterium]
MNNKIPYRGFLIRPNPHLLTTGKWSLEVYIEKHKMLSATNRKFFTNDTFGAQADAVHHSIDLARRIIDGRERPFFGRGSLTKFSENKNQGRFNLLGK